MPQVKPLTLAELEAAVEHIRRSPTDEGSLDLIVRRPRIEEREVLHVAQLCLREGLVGGTWAVRHSTRTPDGSAHPDMQLNIMNSRVIALVAQDRERWPLAGDQLYIKLDLSDDNLQPGTRLHIGSAIIEVTEQPHTGCHKFMARFGADALKFVNSTLGKQLHLRGINAKVVQPGEIRVGDLAKKNVTPP